MGTLGKDLKRSREQSLQQVTEVRAGTDLRSLLSLLPAVCVVLVLLFLIVEAGKGRGGCGKSAILRKEMIYFPFLLILTTLS